MGSGSRFRGLLVGVEKTWKPRKWQTLASFWSSTISYPARLELLGTTPRQPKTTQDSFWDPKMDHELTKMALPALEGGKARKWQTVTTFAEFLKNKIIFLGPTDLVDSGVHGQNGVKNWIFFFDKAPGGSLKLSWEPSWLS